MAVASGLLPFAPGSDGGGSIRIPAAANGLVGLKPSRGRVPSATGFATIGGLGQSGPIARTVADAAMLLDAMIEGQPYEFAVAAPTWDGRSFLNAAVRGEGRYQLGIMTSSPWDDDVEITLSSEADDALTLAITELSAIGHGVEEFTLQPEEGFGTAFLTVWQAAAASIPVHGADLLRLEPLSRWFVETGRAMSAPKLADALAQLVAIERRVIRQFSSFDAVLTPALAHTPRPIGWFDREDVEKNWQQQVQYTPFTSIANVSGLPAITLPVHHTAAGLPMGVQLIGRPGGEQVLLAIGAQLERRLSWQSRHPPQW